MKLNIYKKSNNGFTLVELLAVIVVLAIIALIGFGTVGNIISGAQEGADKETVRQYAKGVEIAITRALARGEELPEELSDDWLIKNVKMTGSEVKCKSVLNKKSVELLECSVQERTTKYCYDGNEVKKCEGQNVPDDEPLQKVYTQEDIDASNGKLVAVGATNALDVVGAYSDDWTTLTITKNGENSDGVIKGLAFVQYGQYGAVNSLLNENTTNIIIEKGITKIGNSAFMSSDITQVTISEGVTIIDNVAFEGCAKLTTVNLPSTITSIGIGSFASTPLLTTINYNGTQEQWNAITLAPGGEPNGAPAWNNNSGNYTIHCTDGDIAKS